MKMKRLISITILAAGAACGMLVLAAARPGGFIEFLNSDRGAPANLPFSEAVRAGDTLYLSGQVGLAPGTGKLAPGGLEKEAAQTMQNIKATLETHGYAMSDVVKCTVMLADIAEWAAFNEVYRTFFAAGRYPARSALGASGLALGARVEVECIAVRERKPVYAGGGPGRE